jgi:hypothetical protein
MGTPAAAATIDDAGETTMLFLRPSYGLPMSSRPLTFGRMIVACARTASANPSNSSDDSPLYRCRSRKPPI